MRRALGGGQRGAAGHDPAGFDRPAAGPWSADPFAISLILSLGLEVLPGDVAEAVLGQSATPDTVAALRRQLGVDRPPHIRYPSWLADLVGGDLGTSLANQQPVAELIGGRLANTLLLAAAAALIVVPVALSLGVVAAVYREGWLDTALSIVGLSATSLPDFFIAYLVTLIFAVELRAFPAVSIISPGMSPADKLHALVLPVLTLSLVVGAHMMRLTRAAILNLLRSPYIEMAQLKGLSPSRIIVHHAVPNAVSPIINVVVLNLSDPVGVRPRRCGRLGGRPDWRLARHAAQLAG